jgi:hypothetical protein
MLVAVAVGAVLQLVVTLLLHRKPVEAAAAVLGLVEIRM